MSTSIAILGCTGIVGQKVIALLQCKPHFKIVELVASDQKVGALFGEIVEWREVCAELSPDIASIQLSSAEKLKAKYIISCLPSEIAQKVEPRLAEQGKIVFSNASALRMRPNVPLLVPEINFTHFSLLSRQKTPGKIITNPNCSAVGVSLGLAPLLELGRIEHVSVVTLQSISGAGYPGISSFDILGNTIPHIAQEAEKITEEVKKILGDAIKSADFAITTSVHRVPVMFGHVATIHVTFADQITPELVVKQYVTWNEKHGELFVVHKKAGRPQAAKDLRQNDMRVHVGHLELGDKQNVLKFVVLSHNLVRGAAGAVIANIECYLKKFGE